MLACFVLHPIEHIGLRINLRERSDFDALRGLRGFWISFNVLEFVQTLLIMHGHFSILAVLYYQYQRKLQAVEEKLAEVENRLEVEKQKTQFEYASLAAQVSPHTMANVFMSWENNLIGASNLDVATQVQDMYQLMLFYMNAHQTDGPSTILLADEVDAVKRFIGIQEQITTRSIFVKWDVQGNLYGTVLPPTAILTLVENAIKYGDIYDVNRPLTINIQIFKGYLKIEVINKIAQRRSTVRSHGKGLNNLRRRLDIVFGDSYSLGIKQDKEYFQASLVKNM